MILGLDTENGNEGNMCEVMPTQNASPEVQTLMTIGIISKHLECAHG